MTFGGGALAGVSDACSAGIFDRWQVGWRSRGRGPLLSLIALGDRAVAWCSPSGPCVAAVPGRWNLAEGSSLQAQSGNWWVWRALSCQLITAGRHSPTLDAFPILLGRAEGLAGNGETSPSKTLPSPRRRSLGLAFKATVITSRSQALLLAIIKALESPERWCASSVYCRRAMATRGAWHALLATWLMPVRWARLAIKPSDASDLG